MQAVSLSLLLSSLSLLLAAVPALANPFETVLPNGLKVVVKEDHRAPTAVHMVWYRAGSMDETDGTSGVAHVLEHMMFKGTAKVPAGAFSDRVADLGGEDNAFTAQDYTAFFQQVPKQGLAEVMALEADRMGRLRLTREEFAPEMKVIMEERRLRTDDDPAALLYEALDAAAFQAHPYRRPVIGWMGDLEHMTVADARDWYRRWYAPNNAIVVVVGDVDHAEVFRLAARDYGGYRPRSLPPRRPSAEPPQAGIRRLELKAPARLPYLIMAWKVPRFSDPATDRDPYALEMLAAVLDGHAAARLGRHLVREQAVAQSAGAGYDGRLRGEALFLLDGQPLPGKSVAELEAALREEIRRIRDEGVGAEELERARTQIMAEQVYQRDSLMAQAMEIGQAETAGYGWRALDTFQAGLRRVSAADVRAVAGKYFDDDRLTVAVLDPQPLPADAADPAPRPASGPLR